LLFVEWGGSVTHFPGLLGPALAAYLTTARIEGWSGIGQLTARLFLISRPRSRFWVYTLTVPSRVLTGAAS